MHNTNTLYIGKVSYRFDQLPSTNDHAVELLARGPVAEGTLILADHQTAGRGQMGSSWWVEAGKNLTLSVILHPRFLLARQQFGLSQAMALAVRDTLVSFLDLPVLIKWPNDILVREEKACGLLIQNTLAGNWIQSSIIGIGLNVNQLEFPPQLGAATSMRLAAGRSFDRQSVLQTLLYQIEQRYLQLKAGRVQELRQDYYRYLYQREVWAQYTDAQDRPFQGKITGVNEAGKLIVDTDNGTKTFAIKEIKFLAN